MSTLDDVWGSALGVLKVVAPTVATVLGGPLAGTAVNALVSGLGLPADTTKAALATALLSATPDQLLAIKKVENDFAVSMKQLELSMDELSVKDTASARSQTVALAGDHSPLAYGALLVSMVVMALYAAVVMGWAPHPDDGDRQLLYTALTLTLGYWLGSSVGSARKDVQRPLPIAPRP